MRVKKIKLKVRLFLSLMHQKIIIDHLKINGTQLVVRQYPDHRYVLNDLEFPNNQSNTMLPYMNIHYHLSHINLTYLGLDKTTIDLHNLKIVNKHHRAHLSSEQLSIISPNISSKQFIFNHVSTDFSLSQNSNNYLLSLTNVQLKNAFFTTHGSIELDYPALMNPNQCSHVRANMEGTSLSTLPFNFQGLFSRCNTWEVSSADLMLGDTNWSIKNNNGLIIQGKIRRADVVDFFQYLPFGLNDERNQAASTMPSIRKITVDFEQLFVAGYPFKKAMITAAPSNHAWLINIHSQDIVGKFKIPNALSKQPIYAEFKRFSLLSKTLNAIKKSSTSKLTISPGQIPSFDVRFNNVYYNKQYVGRIHLITAQHANTLLIRTLTVNNKNLNLSMTGQWNGQGNQSSMLSGHIITADLGDFLNDWDISDSLEGAEGTLDFKLQWSGPIYEMNLAKLNGKFIVALSNGVILDISDNNLETVGNILNIISIDSLEFLLSKPFGTIASKRKGFDFEVEKANIDIVNGTLYTNNFYLKGKLAEVKSQGQIGLAKRNYNLYVTITPYLTAYLPMSLSLAGGPVMYGIVWTANKFMGGIFNVFFKKIYHVTGTWQKPIYQKVTSVGAINSSMIASSRIPDKVYKN